MLEAIPQLIRVPCCFYANYEHLHRSIYKACIFGTLQSKELTSLETYRDEIFSVLNSSLIEAIHNKINITITTE